MAISALCSQPPWHSVDKLVSAYEGLTCARSYTETGAYMRNKVSLCGGSCVCLGRDPEASAVVLQGLGGRVLGQE